MLLKDSPLFRNLSRRLLIDVAEGSVAGRLRSGPNSVDSFIKETHSPGEPPDRTIRGMMLAIVVLKGSLIAANTPKGDVPRPPFPSPLLHSKDLEFSVEITTGVHLRNIIGERIEPGKLRLEAPKGQEVDVLIVPSGVLQVPAVAWGTDLQALSDRALDDRFTPPRTELIWMAAPSGSQVPAEALMHVLAGQIALHYPAERAAVVNLDKTPEVLLWRKDRFVEDKKYSLPKDIKQSDLFRLVQGGPKERGRVFVLNSTDMMTRPKRLEKVLFDRAVYFTDEVPLALPKKIDDLLNPEVKTPKADKAHFSAFIPSISPGFAVPKTGAKGKKFKAGRFCRKKAGGNSADDETMMAFMRCLRDSAVLSSVDVDLLADTWADWQAGGGSSQPQPFHTVAVGSGAISDSILGSWGRAVTNRRVGVACSGGGASAYRIGPVLKRIDDANIPVDVFAGLSGGALIGSFYSRWGMDGFDMARCLGPFFQLTMPLVLLWTRPWEYVMDYFLEGARVEDLGIRFAAVAAALPETDPPSATVVVHGTLGEAVRVSGSLPPSFAPSDKNGIRYADGGAGTAVPAQVARDCGADVVLACNVIPGPKRGNPYSVFPFGWLVRKTPLLGRLVDNYTWYAFFMAQASREFAASADVFVEFAEQNFPLLESSAFIAAEWIIAEAEKEGPYLDGKVDELQKKWQALK